MKPFNKIAIIGVGLIGGSIGKALRSKRLARQVTGVFRRKSSMDRAIGAKAVDSGTLDMKKGVSGADLVIIVTPVSLIPQMAKKCAPFMRKGSILTDAGSVKEFVENEVRKHLPRGVHFVGAHPMAGSEKTGVGSARGDLFRGAVTIVTKSVATDKGSLKRVKDLWAALGSEVVVMSPMEHDKRVALASHLPHIAAQSICLAVDKGNLKFAAGGFRDTTRIALSDPYMWNDIFRANRKEIVSALDVMVDDLVKFKSLIRKNAFTALLSRSKRARDIREKCSR
ncbi:MAG: prephenate dehydrogenase/arogenate dehydrogenase family protein [Candidatus Omnitrophota bacterium]|jgi:prephenate dehydrogenase